MIKCLWVRTEASPAIEQFEPQSVYIGPVIMGYAWAGPIFKLLDCQLVISKTCHNPQFGMDKAQPKLNPTPVHFEYVILLIQFGPFGLHELS